MIPKILNIKYTAFMGSNIQHNSLVQNNQLPDTFESKRVNVYRTKINPNASFMYDVNLSYEDRLKIASEHLELVNIDDLDLPDEIRFYISKYMLKFFHIDSIRCPKSPSMKYIDTSIEVNKQNLDIVLKHKDKLITEPEYKKILGIPMGQNYHIPEDKAPEYLELYEKSSGKLIRSPLVITSQINQTMAKNAVKVGERSLFYKKLLSDDDSHVFANIGALSKYGFGDVKTLYSLVKSGKLDGRILTVKKDGKEKLQVFVDLSSRKSDKLLRALRSRLCMDLDTADNRFGLTKEELEYAYYHGDLDCYTTAVLLGDLDKIFINMKSEKNKDTLNRLLFQKEILNGLVENNFYKTATNQRIKLAWYFAPNTRKIASELLSENKVMQDFIVRNYIKKPELSNSTDIERQSISSKIEDLIIARDFFESVWIKSGYEEFENALQKAQNLLSVKPDEIQDSNLRKLFALSSSFANRDFLPLT